MGLIKGGASRLFETFLYLLTFLVSAVILGIQSYFLAVLADRKKQGAVIPKRYKAIEGISGIAVVYTFFAVLLTCCFGGITPLALLAIVIDVLLIGGMIAIVIESHGGQGSCSNGTGYNPLGQLDQDGFDHQVTYAVHYKTACGLNKAIFACGIIGAILFLCTAVFQIQLMRSHKKQKAYGPGPDNNYTSGKKTGFFARRKANKVAKRDAEMGPTGTAVNGGGLTAGAHDTRPSHETGYTGSTVAGPNTYDKVETGYGAGYHTQPTGTATNY
ncbi:Hypothetical protein R9X50_00700000 [Acrodontium crateriforme]|uniref:MARVEL domain-containing protein n=1 Tax=Acrodontium crateriforme TaxID=150365 RepID=A0AAQ3MAN8_9PEZI|nr:Hypothetical protein R9X50_00700000 [Acrodontium crateriforme]